MIIKSAEFITSAASKKQYPKDDIPEIAFAGRSNVGKSSLINLIFNRKKLAKVSSSPGKTRTINFFDINDGEFRVVDLPGYGYAKVSKEMSNDWGKMMESYLTSRENLKKVIQLVDIRHDPTALDIQMYDFLKYYNLDGIVVATKADKLSKNEIAKSIKNIRSILEMSPDDKLIVTSSISKQGVDDLLKEIDSII